jgi:ribosomal protein S18 acetylase RimI-like enzyme
VSTRALSVRLALPSDVAGIAGVHVRSWQLAYRGHMPDAFLDALDTSQRAARWSQMIVSPRLTVLVALDAGSVVGFCSFRVSEDDDASPVTCELAALYVDPPHWRSGFGAALLAETEAIARQRGFEELTLWVLTTNASARAFYESRGFSADGRSKTDSRLGLSLNEVRYRRNVRRADD